MQRIPNKPDPPLMAGVRLHNMILKSPYKPHDVTEILREEVDKPPSLLRCIVTLNAHYYSGTAAVCGTVLDSRFELRNRSGPAFSLRAKGTLSEIKDGTEIQINFSKPMFPDILGVILFNRYQYDQEIIIGFLKHYLRAKEKGEESAPPDRQ
jgi:hypothetical protein